MSQLKNESIRDQIRAITARQHGVVTRAQLLELGLTSAVVDGWIRSHRLRRLHRGVYLGGAFVGSLAPERSREMAAVLAASPEAWVSHASGARLWQLRLRHPDRAGIHVTILGHDRGRRPGIIPHRVSALSAEDTTEVDGIPVTTPARTVIDLASQFRPRVLEQVMAEAQRKGLAEIEDVAAALERKPRTRGAFVLRRLIETGNRFAFTRSEAEERLLALIAKGEIPTPETNARVGQDEVDFFWPLEGVVVEVDGFQYHSSRQRFEVDRQRDARLAAMGLYVVRVTWRRITENPHAVLVQLAQVLALARADPDPASRRFQG
jgi:very-short-patch-repair endonuclease/predicted transcriptional regulator of viral defense system